MKNAHSIFYLIGTTILLIVINTIFFLFQTTKNEKNHEASMKTYEIIETASQFLDNLEVSEIHYRRYLMTLDSNSLAIYSTTEKSLDDNYIKLYSLLNGNLSQQRNLGRLNELINLKRVQINKIVKRISNGSQSQERKEEDLTIVKNTETHTREVVKNITGTEKENLDTSNKDIEKLTRRIQIFTVISNWILLIIVVSVLINVIQSRDKIGRLFKQIQKKNKQLEDQKGELQNLSKDLLGQNTELERFAYVASHDLRSPALNMISLLQIHEDSKDHAERSSLIKTIKSVADNLIIKLDDLIDVLRNKHEPFGIQEKLNFMHVYNVVEKNLTADIKRSSAKLHYDFSAAPEIYYPKSYLESIMQNLLSNALKYRHPDRVPEISVRTMLKDNKLLLEVKDNGLGIDLKKHGEEVFGIYKTFHNVKGNKGIGLYITKAQIIAMGGNITLESIPNHGSTFTVYFN
ncbi:ATP-binding protein [Pedobacter sp. P351]|uniref:ATP-binding protein n=1 Tax=Pedobacter superstes TaxID=3133441 RepID=UPI0030A95DF3